MLKNEMTTRKNALIMLFSVIMFSASVNAEWSLRFTARDVMGGLTNYYKDYGDLAVLADDSLVELYDLLSGDYQYGNQIIDLTPYISGEGSRVTLMLNGTLSGVLLYDVEILHDGKPVRATPWTVTKSDEKARAWNHSDTRLVMMLGKDLTGYNFVKFTTQPLIDSPELVINQSDLKFTKTIYEISDGDNIGINATVHNVGGRAEEKAFVKLYIDDVYVARSDDFRVGEGSAETASFRIAVDYKGKKFVKIEAKVMPSNPLIEGREDNNAAVKYIIRRPSMYFTDIEDTPIKKYWGQQPYASWYLSLQSGLSTCYALNYSRKDIPETQKAQCLEKMALYYQITGDTSYANKTRWGLTHIGDGAWTWADRSMDGSAKKGSLKDGVDENYGLDDVSGRVWGQVLLQNALAYDWIHEYSAEYDRLYGTNSTQQIRDRIAHLATDTYLLLKEIYSYGDYGSGVSAFTFGDYGTHRLALEGPFGVAALAILDYEGEFEDLDGSPHEWIQFVEKDLAVESQTGARLSQLDQHMSGEGLFEEGGGYRDYYEPSLSYFIVLYEDVLGVNMAEKYRIVNGTMKDIPLMMSPPGRYPNYCVSYASVWPNVINSLLLYDRGSPMRELINYYVDYSIIPNKGYRRQGDDWGAYYSMLVYDKNEPHSPPREPSFLSENGSYNILRSGWDRNALYAFLKAPNEPTMSGHAPMEYHQLSFDLWADGAYLVVDGGDERFLDQYAFGDTTYGHSTWLFYEDGSERWIKRDTKGQYGDTCDNPSYITSRFTSDVLDYVRGDMSVSRWIFRDSSGKVTNPFNVTRSLFLVEDDYLFVVDSLESNASNRYSMLIPLGSAAGYSGDPQDYFDNWVLGNLSLDGRETPWFDYSIKRPVNSRTPGVGEIVWSTVSETNNIDRDAFPVDLHVFLNPASEVVVNVSGMHYGDYGANYEWAFPYARVNQEGSGIRYVTVYYPVKSGGVVPRFSRIPVEGGDGNDYAAKLASADTEDIILASDNDVVRAEGVFSDASVSFTRSVGGEPDYVFIADGTELGVDNETVLSSSKPVTGLIRFGLDSLTAKISAHGDVTLKVKTGFHPFMAVKNVSYSGKSLECALGGKSGESKPGEYFFSGDVLYLSLEGPGELSVEAAYPDTRFTPTDSFFFRQKFDLQSFLRPFRVFKCIQSSI